MAKPDRIITKRVDMVDELACVRAEMTEAHAALLRTLTISARTIARLDEIILAVAPRTAEPTASETPAAPSVPATQAATPANLPPKGQDEAGPDSDRRASGEAPGRGAGVIGTGQPEEFVAAPGTGEAAPQARDPAPAPDEPRVPRREPSVRTEGGGLVQDGGSLTTQPATAKDRVLDRYAATGDYPTDISAALGVPKGTAGATISMARGTGDPRVKEGDERRAAKLTGTRPSLAKPAVPAAPPPAAPRLPLPTPASIAMAIPDGLLIRVKAGDGEVHGPRGIWQAGPHVAAALGMMADGKLYGFDRIAKRGEFDAKKLEPMMSVWAVGLAKIGIRLVSTKGIGAKLNLIEGNA